MSTDEAISAIRSFSLQRTSRALLAAAFVTLFLGMAASQMRSPITGIASVEATVERGAAMLEAEQPQQALEFAREALEAVDDPRLLDLASRAAVATGDLDRALWYARHALDLAASDSRFASLEWALGRRLERLDPLGGKAQASIAAHFDSLYSLGEYARRSRLPANAIDLFSRLDGTPLAAKADRQIRRMLAEPEAARALRESDLDLRGYDLLLDTDRATIEARDGSHREWKDADRIEGPNYTVVTNAGYEKGLAVSRALESIRPFYEAFFEPLDLRSPGSCTIALYRTRDEFRKREKVADFSIEAFFDPQTRRVAAYDPTSVGLPFSDLWATLFHEASHQFTDRISYAKVPPWILEGTSTYFEGATLRGAGIVRPDRIPERRLRALLDTLDRGTPTLRQVIAVESVRRYPREYYAVGWGIVYFLLHYTDSTLLPIYRDAYFELVTSYRTPSRMAPEVRFDRAFIEGIEGDAVESFEDFERRFRAWIRTMAAERDGPPEAAARALVREAAAAAHHGRPQLAIARYQDALRLRHDDTASRIAAHVALGRLFEDRESIDAAILEYRRAVRLMRRESPTKRTPLEKDCIERIRKASRAFAVQLDADESELANEVTAAVVQLVDEGYRRHAAFLVRDAITAIGEHPGLAAARAALGAGRSPEGGSDSDSDDDVRRWRPLPTSARLTEWIDTTGFDGAGAGIVRGSALRTRTARLATPPRIPYRYEVTFELDGKQRPARVGLLFGSSVDSGESRFFVDGRGAILRRTPERGPLARERLAALAESSRSRFTLAVDVDESGLVRYYANDIAIGERRFDPQSLRGRVGILLDGGTATFRDLRIRY